MSGLFQKARIVALSMAHSLMDKAIDLNSIGAVKQYLRDLENALEDLEDASATATGHVRTVQRDAIQIGSQIKELNQNIDFILADSKPDNDYLATPLEARLIGLEQLMLTKEEEIAAGQKAAQAIAEAVSTLRTRYEGTSQQVQRLEAMEMATKAKESAVEAIRQAGQMASTGSNVSIDDVSDRIQRRADVVDARFEMAMGDLGGQLENDLTVAQAQARLEQRKARLASSGSLPDPEKKE
ncbi:MAG: PspA/IM30 family protein [bacterium]